jgi:hypothetical protein
LGHEGLQSFQTLISEDWAFSLLPRWAGTTNAFVECCASPQIQKQTFRAALKERHLFRRVHREPKLGQLPAEIALGNARLPFIGMIVQLFGRCLFDLP